MSERLVLCSECGQKNRIPDKQGIAKCGACKKELAINGHVPRADKPSDLFWVLAVFGLIGLAWYNWPTDKRQSRSTSYSSPLEQTGTLPTTLPFSEVPPESDGPWKRFGTRTPVFETTRVIVPPYGEAIAPISIKTAPGYDYYVKVVRPFTNAVVMEIYISGGDTFEGLVPLGTYRIKYASGKTWYGRELLFDETVTSEADRNFSFRATSSGVSGYSIELIRQVGGNLATRRIPLADF